MFLMACGTSGGPGGDDVPGDDAPPGEDVLYLSGSRIKSVFAKGSDGSKVFQGNHDSMRNEDCSFQPAADGMRRCLPTDVMYTSAYYSDAACTMEVGLRLSCVATIPKYIRAPADPTCGGAVGSRFYLSGAPTTTVFVKSGASCTSTPALAGYTLHLRGAEVAPTEFVAATIVIE